MRAEREGRREKPFGRGWSVDGGNRGGEKSLKQMFGGFNTCIFIIFSDQLISPNYKSHSVLSLLSATLLLKKRVFFHKVNIITGSSHKS